MDSLKKIKISNKVFGGFGIVLCLLILIAVVGFRSLNSAKFDFGEYRSLARQTNQAGRIQANMLMTRMFAKNFMLSPSEKNISGVHKRAKETLSLIPEARKISTDPKFTKILDNVEKELKSYIVSFTKVTEQQKHRSDIVNDTLNVVGPQMEKELSAIMQSAFKDGDAEAAFRAGNTLRNLLLARLYVVKYLIQNDEPSHTRVLQEFAAMDKNAKQLNANLQNPERQRLAIEAEKQSKIYAAAFEDVHKTIVERNAIITLELDRIGPVVASEIEKLKLHIKSMQDELGPNAEQDIKSAVLLTIIVSLAALTIGILAAWLIGNGISNPIKSMTSAMDKLANGDKQSEIPGQDHQDEIGQMAGAVQIFKDNMIKADQLANEQAKGREDREKRAEILHDLTSNFDNDVAGILSLVTSATTELESSAQTMATTAKETSNISTSASTASEQASANVQTVAAAAEELSSSIDEISRQVAQSTQISSTAVSEVEGANDQVQGLAQASVKIGEVVALITDIADQTNLLALNATIEAARAGDAGKGFAVVASEVKNLANQTARATEEISSQISGIQNATQDAVQSIGSIGAIINQMNEISSAIAAAVEEQGAATGEIARNVDEAATGTAEVSSNISSVNQAAGETGQGAVSVGESAKDLVVQNNNLKAVIDKFLEGVRTA